MSRALEAIRRPRWLIMAESGTPATSVLPDPTSPTDREFSRPISKLIPLMSTDIILALKWKRLTSHSDGRPGARSSEDFEDVLVVAASA